MAGRSIAAVRCSGPTASGLKHIADRLSYYAKETNDPSLEPAPLLKRLAAEGKTFASLATEKSKAA